MRRKSRNHDVVVGFDQEAKVLPGIRREPGFLTTETILMRSKTGSVRHMRYRNPVKYSPS